MKPAILGSIVSFRDLQWFRILSYPPSTLSCAKARESSILILLREMQVLKMNLSDQKRLRKGTTHSFWTSAVYNTPFADLSFGAINCIDHHWSIIRPLGLFCTIGINSAMSERFTLIILTPCTRITWIWRVWSSHQWLLDSPRVPLRVPLRLGAEDMGGARLEDTERSQLLPTLAARGWEKCWQTSVALNMGCYMIAI